MQSETPRVDPILSVGVKGQIRVPISSGIDESLQIARFRFAVLRRSREGFRAGIRRSTIFYKRAARSRGRAAAVCPTHPMVSEIAVQIHAHAVGIDPMIKSVRCAVLSPHSALCETKGMWVRGERVEVTSV